MAKEKVEQVLDTLAGLREFSSSPYLDALKSHLSLNDSGMFSDSPNTIYAEAPGGDDRVLQLFKVQTIVLGLSRSSGCSFDHTVNAGGIESKIEATASSIAHTMYRDYLENAVAASGHEKPSLLALEKDREFCMAFADYVLDPDFIKRTLIYRFLSSSSAYPQAVAYIYERVRATLAKTEKHMGTSRFSARDHWQPHAVTHEGLIDARKVDDFLQVSLPVQWSSEDGLQGPSFPLLGQRISVQWCSRQDWRDLVNGQINICYQEPSRTTPVGTGTHPPIPIIGAKTYGKQLQEWIRGKRAEYRDLFTGLEPNNYTPARDAASQMLFGCFVAGTQVRTIVGDVNIESLQRGAQVLTKAPGEYGTLSDERVENHTAEDGDPVYVFGFNGEKPFVTAGHIFFTTAGPKAISPAIAREENPNVIVSQLRVGDELYRLDEASAGTKYAKVRITSFTVDQTPDNVVYGLHFHQGSHGGARYHANGYLVAANYPEITLKRFQDRFANLPIREQKTSIAAIQSMPNSLSGVFGSVFTSFKNTFTPDRVPQPGDLQAIQEHSQKRMQRNRMSVHSVVMAFALQPVVGVVAERLPEVWLKEGAVMVDAQLVHRAEVTHQHVYWSREKAPGVWEHGSLQFSSDSLMATGAVAIEEGGNLSSPVPVVAAPVQLLYSPSGTKKTFPDPEKADGYSPSQDEAWLPFWDVKIEMVQSNKGLFQAKASLPQVDPKYDKPIYEARVTLHPGELIIDIRISDGLEDSLADILDEWPKGTEKPQLFKGLKLIVNLVRGVARGHYTELVEETGEDGDIHALHASGSDKHQQLMEEVPRAIASSPIAHLDYGLNADLYSISANIHTLPSPKAALLTAAMSGKPLSIPDLQLIETPTDFDNHRVTQNYVMAAAGYWRGKKEKEVFGDSKGANEGILPISLKDQLNDNNRKFLSNVYTRALFLYSLSTDSRYEGNFNSEQKEKLQYFWEGKAQSCISRKPEFSAVNSLAVKAAYLDQVPRLKDYINDSEDWAKKYYEAVSTDDYLSQMAFAKLTGYDLVNRVCMLLSVLDKQNRGYPEQLWKLILDKSILILSYEGAPVDPDGFSKFAVDFMEQLIIKIKTKDPSISQALLEDLSLDIETLQKTYNTKVEREIANELFGNQTELGRMFMELVREGKDYLGKKNLKPFAKIAEKMRDKAEKWLSPKTREKFKKTYGVLVKVGAIMTQAYQLATAIKYMAGWDHLSDIDRAKATLQVVESTFRLIGDMAPIIKQLGENAWNSSKVRYLLGRWNQSVGGSQGRVTVPIDGVDTPVLNHEGLAAVNSQAVEPSLEAQVGEVTSAAQAEEKLTRWAKASKVGSVMLKSVVALSNVAVVVGLGFQIEKEWGYENVGVIILDIINLSTVAAQVTVEVLEIGYAIIGIESVVLPLIGAVLAIVGIIIMFIEMGVGHTPPPDPTVTYINDVTPGFVKELSLRPKPILNYKAPNTAPTAGSWSLKIEIKDESGKDFRVESFHIEVPVGNTESDLFSRPDTKDANGPKSIQCVVSDTNRFSVKASVSPSSENHIMLFQVSAIDKTKPVGELSVTFAGTLNGLKGKANISITEVPPQDKDAKPDDSRTDRVKSLVIAKQ